MGNADRLTTYQVMDDGMRIHVLELASNIGLFIPYILHFVLGM